MAALGNGPATGAHRELPGPGGTGGTCFRLLWFVRRPHVAFLKMAAAADSSSHHPCSGCAASHPVTLLALLCNQVQVRLGAYQMDTGSYQERYAKWALPHPLYRPGR